MIMELWCNRKKESILNKIKENRKIVKDKWWKLIENKEKEFINKVKVKVVLNI